MRILMVGGGSGGPVSPLLAVAEHIKLKHPQSTFLFVGTYKGPERDMVEKAGFEFKAIISGRLRRYFSYKNFFSPFLLFVGFFQSFFVLAKFKPNAVFGAGSFVQVPLLWAAWFFRTPIVIHQQDVVPSLANRFCSWIAKRITVTFPGSTGDFSSGFGLFFHKPSSKVQVTGNPFLERLRKTDREEALRKFNLHPHLPVLLVFGGGTGAQSLNTMVQNALPALTSVVQVLHISGNSKFKDYKYENYHQYRFLTNMQDAYAVADVVLARAGLSTITELSNLGKVSIIVPMPQSHQEQNAKLLAEHGAALVIPQQKLNAEILVRIIRQLLVDGRLQKEIEKNIKNIMSHSATQKVSDTIIHAAIVHS